ALWRGAWEQRPPASSLWPLLGLAAVLAAPAPGADVPAVSTRTGWSRVRWSTITTVALLLLLAPLGVTAVYSRLGPRAATVVHSLRSGQLSRADTILLERGYYEDLVRVDRFNSQLWEVYMNKPVDWLDVRGLGLDRFTGDIRRRELVPSFVAQTRFGPIRTNRWGMRDREYERHPPPGTYRFALLGASTVMGWGVGDGETFEALVEDRLNRDRPGSSFARYEVLNLAVPGYELPQQLATLDAALAYAPNAVMYAAIGREMHGSVEFLAGAARDGTPIPYGFLRDVIRRAGIDASTDATTARRRLEPYRAELVAWMYGEMARRCRERSVLPVLAFLPQTYRGVWEQEGEEVLRHAREAGFVTLDLRHLFQDHDPGSLRLAEWDAHPNARAHQIMAAGLYDALAGRSDVIFARQEARP
ncbi:MAG TPA: SGNH/GDSL hydrolase family protein, partial [Methylomirabilota bacterium]|nr:SGNH/GDSL hydrolase family protein [Methylomirabilota bacterium]